LFWPALFFLDGDNPQAVEYARLKGERETLEKVAIDKNCRSTPRIVDVDQPKNENAAVPASTTTKETRLLELKQLREKGLISEENYQSEQRRILAQ